MNNNIDIIWNKGSKYENEDFFELLIDTNFQNDIFRNYFNKTSVEDINVYKDPDLFLDGNNNIAVNDDIIQEISKSLAVFILIELDWSNEEDFGISIIQKLRNANVKVPVFFCSFHDEEYFKEKKADIIFFNGHYFINLPNEWESQTVNIESLDEIQLMDIKFHFTDLAGNIRSLFHEMKGEVRKAKVGENATKQQLYIIHNYLSRLKKLTFEYPELLSVLDGMSKALEEGEEKQDELKRILKLEDSSLLSYLNDKPDESLKQYSKKEWQLLWLDDQPGEVETLKNALEKRGIKDENIHMVKNYEHGVKEFLKDKENRIHVIIADYRIKDEKNGYRTRQGYQFLQWCSQQKHFHQLFAFSGLSHNFVENTFRKYNVKVDVRSKNMIENETLLNEFADEIIEKGDEIQRFINNLPDAENWQNLEPFYIYLRSHSGYRNILEEKVFPRAKHIVNQVRRILMEPDTRLFSESVNKIDILDNLTAKFDEARKISQKDLYKFKPNDIIIERSKKGDIYKYLPKDHPYEPQNFDNFLNKLTARMVFWWLHYFEGISQDTIGIILKWGLFFSLDDYLHFKKGGVDKKKIQASIRQLYFQLALQLEDFPERLLIEEKNWIKYFMGIDIENPAESIHEINDKFEKFIEHKWSVVAGRISSLSTSVYRGKVLVNSFFDIKRVSRIILNNLKRDYQILYIRDFAEIFLVRIEEDPYTLQYADEIRKLFVELKNEYKVDYQMLRIRESEQIFGVWIEKNKTTRDYINNIKSILEEYKKTQKKYE